MLKDEFGTNRGFGFVTFADISSVNECLENKMEHNLRGKPVDVKRCRPISMNYISKFADRNVIQKLDATIETLAHENSRKLFVGGLPKDCTVDAFK